MTNSTRPSGGTRDRLVDALRTIERLQRELAATRSGPPAAEPIAVVGLSCRMPGGADTPAEFWRLLGEGYDASREFPAERADARALYDPDPDAPGRAYTINGSFLDQVDLFEPEVFGIAPREAVGMDPQQRLTLEVAWEALERAGHAPDRLDGSRTGVYLGVSTTDYVRLRQEIGDRSEVDAYTLVGEPSFIAGRIAYTLGLQGPVKVMDTTCSSSLVAVHEACQALRLGECDLALAGGSNVMLAPYGFLLMSKFRALSPDGRCKTFDASADGYGRGEGVGIVVLRRLSDAVRDRDHVHAVIRGSAVNHDGRSSGLTVPNPAAQQAVVRSALTMAGVDPGDVSYVEAHGTGTSLGDPIELRALEAVVGRLRDGRDPLMVGSVKTNIGHLESAAGIAGLIKLVLAVEHGEIPPHLHLTEPNPNVDWDKLHITVPTERRPWTGPRIGGLSSFGASGTNAHAVVAEAPARPSTPDAAGPDVLVASTRTPEALRELAGRWAAHLDGDPAASVADVCWTSQVGRARLQQGLAVVGGTPAELVEGLAAYAAGADSPRLVTGAQVPHRQRRTAWLFTGQGAQYAGMARELAAEPAFRAAFEQVAALADARLDRPLASVVWPEDGATTPLDDTGWTQPALFAVEYALAAMWSAWGVRPVALAGHSVGEIAAACVAGVLSLPDAVTLVVARGRLMSALPAGGGMRSVSCDEPTARAAIGSTPGVAVAGVNAPGETVLSGPDAAVAEICARLAADGVRSRPLVVSHAFHSPLMEPMLAEFRTVLDGLSFAAPRIPLVSNLTGALWTDAEVGPDYWVRHVGGTVRFADGVRALHAAGARAFLEIGPHPVLTGLGERTVEDPDCAWLPSMRRGADARLTTRRAAAALHLRGTQVDWDAVRGGGSPRRVDLPTTPWQGRSFWFRPLAAAAAGPAAGTEVPGLGRRLRTAVPTYELADGDLDLGRFVLAARTAAGDAYGGRWPAVADAALHAAAGTVQLVLDTDGDTVTVTARGMGAAEESLGGPWRTLGTATLRRRAERAEPVAGKTVPVEDGDWPAAGFDSMTRLAAGELPATAVAAVRTAEGGTDADLLGPDGELVGTLRGLAADAGGTPGWAHPDELLMRLDWQDAAPAAPADPAGTAVLLVADPGGPAAATADRLAAVLRARGADVTTVPTDGLGAAARRWRSTHDGARVVLLSALDAPDPAGTDPDSLRRALHRDELGLVGLVQALADGPPVTVSFVTRGAQPAAPDQPYQAVASAPLWGLGRVLALEHPDLWGTAVDLDQATAVDAELLADALLDPGPEDQQALRGGRRRVARLVPDRLEPAALRRRPEIRPDGTYLVTGGLGGIGLAVAGWLAAAGAGRVVLLGRSGLPPRDRWDDPDLSATARLRVAGVLAAERLGAEVETVAADVTDAGELAAVLERLRADTARPLRGVVHAAGVSGPQFVRDVTAEDYTTVWAPKVVGGWLLDQLTAADDLDLFVSFSTIASVLGSQHLASYAAANAFLDALAHHRRGAGRTALTACWGPWALPSALFGEDVMEFLRSVGLRALDAEECLALLGALLAADATQAVVCAADWAMYKPVMEARRERPVLEHVDAGDPGGDAPAGGLLDELRAADGPQRTELVRGYLAGSLGAALGVDGAGLPTDTDVMELGMDSIMAMEVVKRARRDLAVAVRPSVLFEHPTLAEWATHVLAEVEREHELAAPAGAAATTRTDWSDAAVIKADVRLDPAIRPGATRDPAFADVLLTGATGFVGAFLLDELLATTDARVHCLVRAADPADGLRRLRANVERYLPWRAGAADRVVPLPGDLGRPRLGLTGPAFAELASTVDAIYHSGARVNFAHPYESLRAPNVAGTEEILRLAALGGGRLHHVSSYGMWGLPQAGRGVIAEDDDIDTAGRLITGYVQSKWAAEELVRQARDRGIPVDVHRPGRVLGDSRTGVALTTHFTTRVIKGCIQLGISPDIDIEVEMTPVDYVTRALVHISRTAEPGGTYHLINPVRMPFRQLVAAIRRRGWHAPPVDAVTWWTALRDGLGVEQNELHPVMETVEELVVRGEENVDYGVVNTEAALAGSGIACPPLDQALLDTYFDYLIGSGYLEAPAPADTEVRS